MTEGWAIAIVGGLFGLLQIVIVGILTYIVNKMERICEKMESFVKSADCHANMCKHEDEIEHLWNETRNNTFLLVKLETQNERKS